MKNFNLKINENNIILFLRYKYNLNLRQLHVMNIENLKNTNFIYDFWLKRYFGFISEFSEEFIKDNKINKFNKFLIEKNFINIYVNVIKCLINLIDYKSNLEENYLKEFDILNMYLDLIYIYLIALEFSEKINYCLEDDFLLLPNNRLDDFVIEEVLDLEFLIIILKSLNLNINYIKKIKNLKKQEILYFSNLFLMSKEKVNFFLLYFYNKVIKFNLVDFLKFDLLENKSNFKIQAVQLRENLLNKFKINILLNKIKLNVFLILILLKKILLKKK